MIILIFRKAHKIFLTNKITFVLFILLALQAHCQHNYFNVFAVTDLKRVFEDAYNLPEKFNKIELFGIRNEFVSGQFVINAKSMLTNVEIGVSTLINKTTEDSISAEFIKWNFVGNIPLSSNTPNQPTLILERIAPATYPDYLMAETQLSIEKGKYQSVWLTLLIPEHCIEGVYSGTISIRCIQGEQSLPIDIKVYPLTLPETRNLKVTEWYTTRHFPKVHGIDKTYSEAWFAMLKKYADNMVEHRQNVFQVPISVIDIYKSSDGTLEFDFVRFDQIADIFWNTGKMDYLETGELFRFGENGWSGTEIISQDFNIKDIKTCLLLKMKGDDLLPFLLQAIESHLREKNWLHKTYFHVKDEPSLHNAKAWRKASNYVHNYAPDLQRMDAIETTWVLNDIEVAVPKLDAFASWYKAYKKSIDKGIEHWIYTVGIYQGSLLPNKTIDMPLIDSRLIHWLNYKYDAAGFLHWGWNQWVDDPYNDTGEHTGDGYHVYPVKNGVLNSMRWEQMRNGIQDYECFYMLGEKIQELKDSLGSRFSWIEPTQRGKEISFRVATNLVRYSRDPDILYKAKKDLINELLDFESSPQVYVQTNPIENSKVINRSIIELSGWVEPGSTVTINKQNLPVAYDGLIMGRFIILAGGKLEIKVTKDNKTKNLIREFDVNY